MSTAVEKQLRAAQKYLTLVKTLPVFEGVREQQLQDIKQKLEQVSLNVDQAACLVDLLDETVWGSSLDELRAAMTPRAGSAADNVRKQQQDYTWFLHYITSSMWKGMESLDGLHVLQKLCQHAALLGLRNPTEQSVATLLTLSFDTHGLLLDSEKWSLMQQHKEYIKRPLGKGGKCTLHLLRLPENPEELPEELRLRAFPGQESPVRPEAAGRWFQIAKSWPLRKTHHAAAASMPALPDAGHAVGANFAQMGQMMAAAAGMWQMSLGGTPRGNAQPSCALQLGVRGHQHAASQAPLALMDRASCADEKAELPVESKNEEQKEEQKKECGAEAVASTLNALQAATAPTKDSGSKAFKRPSACPSKVMKRPGAQLKRPAASNVKKSNGVPSDAQALEDSRSQKRARLMDIIPSELKDQWRKGCAKCRFRAFCTVSCWKARGYELPE